MQTATDNFWDILSQDEAESAQRVIGELNGIAWAAPLIAGIRENGGIVHANKDRLFELRFAYALHQAGIAPRYEVPGEARSTVDFGFHSGGQGWRVELLRLGETKAVKEATGSRVGTDGVPSSSRILHSDADDPKQSVEGETLKAVERICQKADADGRPHKFPIPDGTYNVLLVDFRTFMNGGDAADRLHIGLGAESVTAPYRMFWENRPISGVFNTATNLRGAAEMRERVHLLGFVRERNYTPGEFAGVTQFIANPRLFAHAAAAHAAMTTWPLQPTQLLNGAS
ncbi:hypothetical protein [Mesorhizobium sp. BH1-1-4]|uniref:hypothetical protein n=1 Tax=Mesorhizobium sp. BH1-1-4 TaxID=2876662 RepID=UPI001CD06278|nr:hypothetical protein [Mesorhizobium sp. BH1-1-4]MBZ9993149.1 hypothetical protein [Mesorhizobium sp. BH1-1-4]